jgi:hypothetical protein
VLIGVAVAVIVHRDDAAAAARRPEPALGVRLPLRERRAWSHFPPYSGDVPVLGYHGVSNEHSYLTVSRRLSAEQMVVLHLAGFHTISIAQ